VLDEGLAGGDSPVSARSASRLLQAYELSFWDALAEWL
jgi:predicted nucleic acid-binding protein